MSDLRHHLNQQDRVELLCWLVVGNLGAFYLNESWPGAAFQVQSAHKWLDRHAREADWLTLAKLSLIALDIARKHADFVNAPWARDAVEEIIDTDDLNYEARLAQLVLDDCRAALADRRIAD
ncbi:hypothetical protein [Burkholderia pseudomallei]|uniref:hypothetical protein n=1 Tax=Burkholderia pseudomallei TaxID=28450 RepID=UPI00016B173C|nr:hypothetical protein [Burkholderia pseudomallei]AGZ28713.1 hypothetical protein BBK_1851 [Burkholderia pseudomallei NCTC 13179]AIV82759.1 hypothetical protein X978_1945 [Burkholderia pseudomallei MSHR3965]KGT01170.1 hypothetical protein JT30_1939 [Burkholderia pseudomallei]KGW16022.1 hypothetical protein X980_5926 [Burkholderia pseudomallei MSHR4000]KIX66065.1 hypothetical protein SZ30_20405 [Burkholderia pseudomallei]